MNLLYLFSVNNLLIASIVFFILLLLPSPIKIFKYLLVQTILGVLLMFAINFFLPFYVNINMYTVLFSSILGIPGVISMYIFGFYFS